MRTAVAVSILLSHLIATPASAVPSQTTFASDAFSLSWDCTYDAAGNACEDLNNIAIGPTTVRPDGVYTSLAGPRGTSWARAEADPGSYLPTLKAYAASNPAYVSAGPNGGSSMVDATVWAVQGYRYTGSTAFTLTLTATLESEFSAGAADVWHNHSMLAVSLFDTDGYVFDYNPAASTGSNCPIILSAPQPGCANMPRIFAQDRQELNDTGSVTSVLSYTIDPGQTFYVGALIDANVCCGGVIDSAHSLRMQFNDATHLESYAVPVVPEPAGWIMMVAGAFLTALWGRKRRSDVQA